MLFLIEYDRGAGKVLSLASFEDHERVLAGERRIEREVTLNRLRIDREVVLLEASSEAALRRTHRRYFENVADLTFASPPEPSGKKIR